MNLELAVLKDKDFDDIKQIYDHYIINSTATFHTEAISINGLKDMIPIGHPKYKSFVIKHDNFFCGYCYFSPYNKRPAYDRTAEVTIYIHPAFKGQGIGTQVLTRLETAAKELNIVVLIGIITGENEASIALFEKCGYEKCAHLKQVGEKFERLLDVVYYQKNLSEFES